MLIPIMMPAVGLPFYGLTVAASTSDYNLATAAQSAGWDGASPCEVQCTINAGVVVGASTTATKAFTVSNAFPSGSTIRITNSGRITGKGGAGGAGGAASLYSTSYGTNGGNGGTALDCSGVNGGVVLEVDNGSGVIAGGGGGGAGGTNPKFTLSDRAIL